MMQWAARTAFEEEENALSRAVAAARAAGKTLVDLTVTNPTRCGFVYDEAVILGALGRRESLRYAAEPMGSVGARRAVAAGYYGARGVTVRPEQMLLTASTSEAYGYVLRLLCDPGDEVLVPAPSYPLFAMLARMQDVRLVTYPLLRHDAWRVDMAGLEQRVTARTRALVAVHPNNPTGHFVGAAERAMLRRFAAERGVALVVDEVFLDYPVEAAERPVSFAAEACPGLTFVMSGLSKVLALPQMKLAWTAVLGPSEVAREALRRLEFVADTFLSVGTPVQEAVGAWLPLAGGVQGQVLERIRENLRALDEVLAAVPVMGRLRVEGGWSVVVRVPALEVDEALAVRLVESAGVVVHPGSFYGFAERGWLVLSLLVPVAEFREGVRRIAVVVYELVTGESGQ